MADSKDIQYQNFEGAGGARRRSTVADLNRDRNLDAK